MSGEIDREAVTLSKAADRLGISGEALRKRLQRGTAEGYRDNRGRWLVYVDADASSNSPGPVPETVLPADLDGHPLVVQLRAQVLDLQAEIGASRDREARLLAIIEQLSREDRADLGALERLRRWLFGTQKRG